MHKKLTEVFVAALADTQQTVLASSSGLRRNDAQPRGEVPFPAKS
jgi:hypothetical protein